MHICINAYYKISIKMGDKVTTSIKRKIAKATSCNRALNKKVLCLRRSLSEVNSILYGTNKKRKKKRR